MEKEREIRLRQNIESLVRSRVGILEQDISRLQREVNESFTRLLERTDEAASLPETDQSLAQIAAEVNAQVDQAGAESARLGADIALLRDSVVELDEQRTQAEVLNALVARAASFAPRIVLFVVKGQNALAWAARGFEDGVGNSAIRGLSVSLQSNTVLRAALNSQQSFYGSLDQHSDNVLILDHFGNVQPQRVLAVPLRVRGKSAAVLYADSADHGEGATNVEAIELLVYTSGLVVELVSLRARIGEAAQAKQPASGAATGQPSATPASTATGELAGARASGPLPSTSSPLPPVQPGGSGELRQPAPPAYFRPASEPAANVGPQASAASGARSGAIDEEEKQHNDARRFARLLVSEIKLYNEQKVNDGRRNNDLYDRLKEDIDRSRQMYEKRVTPVVAAKFDYFYDELVNTLAEGDPIKLGSDHPGPSVRV